MSKEQCNLNYIKTLFQRSEDGFIFLALVMHPTISIFRSFFLNVDPDLKSYINFITLALHLVAFFLVIFQYERVGAYLISIFLRLINSTVAQVLLYFCIWIEQLLFTHPFMAVLLVGPFCFLYVNAYLNYLDYFYFWLLLQCILVMGLVYYRLRRSLLNEQAFESAGTSSTRPYDWATVIGGLNNVMAKKNTCALGQQRSLNYKETPGYGLGSIIIHNRKPSFNGVTFPFLPLSQRRNMATRAAFRLFLSRLSTGFEQAPAETGTLAVTSATAVLSGGYLLYKDRRDFTQKEKELAVRDKEAELGKERLAFEKKQHEDIIALKKESLEAKKQMALSQKVLSERASEAAERGPTRPWEADFRSSEAGPGVFKEGRPAQLNFPPIGSSSEGSLTSKLSSSHMAVDSSGKELFSPVISFIWSWIRGLF